MAIMVPNSIPNTNAGEKKVYSLLRDHLPESCVIYHNKEVYGQEFDFCVLVPEKGIVIIEVKGWKETNEIEVRSEDDIVYRSRNGNEQYFSSPKKQARRYRFNLLDKIQNEINYNPLIIDMVCYPNISKDYYSSVRLDIVSEEDFTILKEDIEDHSLLLKKIGKAFDIAKFWGNHSEFSGDRIKDVRLLFESEEQIRLTTPKVQKDNPPRQSRARDYYSILQYVKSKDEIDQLLNEYKKGTKLYLIAKNREIYNEIIIGQRNQLKELRLIYDKDLLKINHENRDLSDDEIEGSIYLSFNLVVTTPDEEDIPYDIDNLNIIDGNQNDIDKNHELLEWLHNNSGLNYKQYMVEHASVDDNVLVKAGAGTGKTFSMISRLTFLQYMNSYDPNDFIKKIVMITFTNEASDEMKSRLKDCFQNYYMLTKDSMFFKFIELIDSMNITTIHSLSKLIIQKFSSYLGYGSDLNIVSGDYERKSILAEELEIYLQNKIKDDTEFTSKLGIPIYKLIDILIQILNKLQSKSVNIEDKGLVFYGAEDKEPIHELIHQVIKNSQLKYQDRIRDNNSIHLNDLIIKLNQIIEENVDISRIIGVEYLFVDEFQDTDNIQIDLMKKFQEKLGFNFFVVGDIKQCIYRFRGAEEQAFQRLVNIPHDGWNSISLDKNYRTDCKLLNHFEEKFIKWSQQSTEKLKYDPSEDRLVSRININNNEEQSKYYREVEVENPYDETEFGKALIKEIIERENEIKERMQNGKKLKEKHRTIAILVRENWEAQQIKEIGKNANQYCDEASTMFIETDTGEELYAIDPALDLYKLVTALKYPLNPKYLFNLTTSCYFIDLFRAKDIYKLSKDDQLDVLTEIIDHYIKSCITELGITDEAVPTTWNGWCEKLKYEPVLKVLHNLIQILRPWDQYSLHYKDDPDEKIKAKRFYKRNVELLFEKLATTNNQDYITINKLEKDLKIRITTKQKDDIRDAFDIKETSEIKIVCMTVHKSKGLEFDTVILPFGHRKIDELKKNAEVQLLVKDNEVGYKIKIKNIEDRNSDIVKYNSFFDEDQEKEDRMKEETRILYVALTRAIRNFTYFGYTNKPYTSSWQELLKI